jgi:hypothetical protein
VRQKFIPQKGGYRKRGIFIEIEIRIEGAPLSQIFPVLTVAHFLLRRFLILYQRLVRPYSVGGLLSVGGYRQLRPEPPVL